MRKGTTPTHVFKIPFDTEDIKCVRIIYAQNYEEIFTKKTEDCVLEDKTISVTLSQEETLKFDHTKSVQVQLRVLTVKGDALASDVKNVTVCQCLNNEVLV